LINGFAYVYHKLRLLSRQIFAKVISKIFAAKYGLQQLYQMYVFNLRRTLYIQAVLKFLKLDTQAQHRGAVVQERSLSPYRLRYKTGLSKSVCIYWQGVCNLSIQKRVYTQAVLKLNTQSQHHGAVVQGRSLSPMPAAV
jgi:hypothetical protein